MVAFLADATLVVTWLFDPTTGVVPEIGALIIATPVLVLPVVIMLAGLGVGMFTRLIGAVRG